MNFVDPELLRTFLAFVDAGSLARAAGIVGRSPSAVTAQMQRLEEAVGEPLLVPAGRGRVLTPAGDELVIHARRILDANREAWLSLKGARADGRVALGATQDFADSALPDLLRTFARTHARVRLELRIGRSVELIKAFEEGAVDVLIAMRLGPASDEISVLREPMLWLGTSQGLAVAQPELPLAVLDPPCGFRSAAIAALDCAHRPYRIAASSATLSGLRAAVRGGIAITLRTARWIGDGVVDVSKTLSLPPVSNAEFSVRLRNDADAAAVALADLLCESLDASRSAA
jgi:DNA-binding transcriptional LysR family regulator